MRKRDNQVHQPSSNSELKEERRKEIKLNFYSVQTLNLHCFISSSQKSCEVDITIPFYNQENQGSERLNMPKFITDKYSNQGTLLEPNFRLFASLKSSSITKRQVCNLTFPSAEDSKRVNNMVDTIIQDPESLLLQKYE